MLSARRFYSTFRINCNTCSSKCLYPCKLERFKDIAKSVHNNKYNYELIRPPHILKLSSKIPILCNKCHNIWFPSITSHINGKDCPNCVKSSGYSKAQIKWIKSIMERENIYIQHALSPEGEYYIQRVGKVDGYCKENNTVYEYHGNFWHGNPKIFNPVDIHPIVGRPYGELYYDTLARDQRIRDLGYNLITKWA